MRNIPADMLRAFGRFPIGARVVIVMGLLVGVVLLGLKGYRTYDYIQHDNEFCYSCHLMEDPFRRFAESGHRDLSCKECHHPTLIERSKMALTAYVEDPDEIKHSAHVPNSTCADCHIDGDPEQWKLIAGTAGHRVHLESDRPELQGLQCVECHSVAIHDFHPVDRTCGQAGCHVDVTVVLGDMAGASELHCVACHNFLATDSPLLAAGAGDLTPRQRDCLVCHGNTAPLPGFDAASDVHGGECAQCHNPHTQTQAKMAVQSCGNSGCHVDPAGLTPMHRGLAPAVAADCLNCHEAHTWTVSGPACSNCHDMATIVAEGSQFSHAKHQSLDCNNCHDSQQSHGASLLGTQTSCADCHHDTATNRGCTSCHAADLLPKTVDKPLQVAVAGKDPRTHTVQFEHGLHDFLDCEDCHQDGGSFVAQVDCSACHEDHHEVQTGCVQCHGSNVKAKHGTQSHVGCAGSGCHSSDAVQVSVRSANPCLVCHVGSMNHEPGGDCRSCHMLPDPRVERGSR